MTLRESTVAATPLRVVAAWFVTHFGPPLLFGAYVQALHSGAGALLHLPDWLSFTALASAVATGLAALHWLVRGWQLSSRLPWLGLYAFAAWWTTLYVGLVVSCANGDCI